MRRHLWLCACLLLLRNFAAAELTLAPVFSDHLVLQRERPVPLWGTAAPGEVITATFAGQTQRTTADAAGRWRITFAPLPASHESRDLVVQGSSQRAMLRDVLVGEVWFCSGQSNMEKPLGPRSGQRPTTDHDLEIAAANHPALRLLQAPRPRTKSAKEVAPPTWQRCTPAVVRETGFSAAAYYFGRQLQQTLDVPVGLINASLGGTYIDAWMPPEAFEAPEIRGLEKRRVFAWIEGVQPTELFHSMIAPYAPYAVRGFLWYQGETNLMDGDLAHYDVKQAALVATWRQRWEIPDAPFFGVSLAPFEYSRREKIPVSSLALPRLREMQARALTGPGLDYIVTTDLVDDVRDIHPVNKRDVGLRLARLALAQTYAVAGIVDRGPRFRKARVTGASLEIEFDHATGLRTRDGLAPTDFVLAGEDRVFHPATAQIGADGKILLSSPQVAAPVAARFAWDELAQPNLINAAGLPAAPFRTDTWLVEVHRAGPP